MEQYHDNPNPIAWDGILDVDSIMILIIGKKDNYVNIKD